MNAAGGQEADASEMEEKERQPGELEDGLGDMEDDDSEEDDERARSHTQLSVDHQLPHLSHYTA